MALVVLLRGVNVGGHRSFRPSVLAEQLRHLDAVNIGAAGTLVIRKKVTRRALRDEVARNLPFDTEIVICHGRDIVELLSHDCFTRHSVPAGVVRFVSVLARFPRSKPRLPIKMPKRGNWLLKILARDRRFVFGLYKRHMKVVSYLGILDRVFGVPATTRNWNTITAVAKALDPTGTYPRPARTRRAPRAKPAA